MNKIISGSLKTVFRLPDDYVGNTNIVVYREFNLVTLTLLS
ncbi:hypothetical protein [Alysiella crassa]|nr:hypothetical protein [Alysiella crassa]